MDREEKTELISELNEKLNSIKGNTIKDKIKRDKIRLEIKDLKHTMTDEDWQHFLSERSEIDVGKING